MSLTPLKITLSKTLKVWSERSWLGRFLGLLDRPGAVRVGLAIVLLVAALFRFADLNWDDSHNLHPDERFLTSVTNDLKWPDSFENYFDPQASTLSPYSLPNMGLYVYGTLPVYIVKWTAILLDRNNYDKISLVGRAISGLFDIGTICFLFLIGRRLYGKKVGLLAAALLSLTVLNIQLSHFYAVDTFATFFVFATIYFLLRANDSDSWTDFALTGLMFGLGLSSKVSVLTLAVPIALMAWLGFRQRWRGGDDVRQALEHTLVRVLTIVVIAALTFRILQPIAFAGPSFWNWSLNPQWQRDIDEQGKMVSGEADVPWLQQWTDRPASFALYNIVVWGMGLPLGLAGFAGLGLAIFELVRRRKFEHLLPVAYVTVTFTYHAATFVKFMRYFLPIYPFLALLAAYLIAWLWRRANAAPPPVDVETHDTPTPEPRLRRTLGSLRLTPQLAFGVAGVVIGGTLLYALAFSAIYQRPHSRITASRWMYANIPPGATLANEHWDDWLPIGGVDGKMAYGDNGLFKSVEMPNYEDDTPDKLNRLVTNLTQADYVVLSSNRLYDSIPRLPLRYPMTSRYYDLLFRGELGFERVAEFTSYPTILGIQIPDQSAEESFSIYDHPRVQIFKKTAAFNPENLHHQLGDGIAWDAVLHLSPRQASAARQGLRLSADDQQLYRQTAAWSSAEVGEDSWGSQVPVPVWFLILEAIGLLALPLTLTAFGRLADRGYIFSKAIGLLVVGWGAWMIASLHLAPFTWWAILAVMALLALISGWTLRERRAELLAFVQARWRLLLFEEGLFWGFFAISLAIRWRNPDLWHPGLGGEKPMDLAYLTAIVRTPYFPSYDPWFAGGYINYYYFGFVLVATLIHLTGTVPYIAYNLAVPTFFAMTAMGGFAVALNLAEGWWSKPDSDAATDNWLGVGRTVLLAGVCGALFVAVIGNLGQAQLLWDGVRNLSVIKTEGAPSALTMLAQFGDGLVQMLGGHKLEFRTEWWYWNATRVIPAAQGEAGPINEMPFFTFLYADLHAHMLALPYTLLALALALNLVRSHDHTDATTRAWWRDPSELLTLGLLALTTGALWPMNTWDFPTYTALAAAALICREYARRGRVDMAGVWAVAWRIALIVVGGRLLFLPFHQAYASDYFGAELWKGSRTPLWAYLIIHGFFLFVLVSYLIGELMSGSGHNALVRSLRLILRRWRHLGRMQRLFARLAHPTPGYRLAVSAAQVAIGLLLAVLLINRVVGLALGLILLTTLLLFSARPNPRRQLVLCMIGLGLTLTAMVEIIVLKGDISRMNTVFKFYLQVWVLWAVASAAVLPLLIQWIPRPQREKRARAPEPAEGSPWTPEIAAQAEAGRPAPQGTWVQRWWWPAFGTLLAACLLYPLTATPVRVGDRFEDSHAATLDGSAYMRTSVYNDEGQEIVLDWDRQAITWLRQNVPAMSTIVEANTPLYRWGSRVSINTGLPTVIGWDWHQKQQRSVLPGPVIDQRIADVRTIYTSTDIDETRRLLGSYGVQYIYVGPLERKYYAGDGLSKFDQNQGRLWDLVYKNEQVQIYRVR